MLKVKRKIHYNMIQKVQDKAKDMEPRAVWRYIQKGHKAGIRFK